MKVGILAIQGDFELHKIALDKLSVNSLYVRNEKELNNCDALILPGGESTTMSLLLNKYNLFNSVKKFAQKKNLFGTCAGAILMSSNSKDSRVKNLKIIDIQTCRNAWGAQIDSFSDNIELNENLFFTKKYYATFIRGPKFSNVRKTCNIIGSYHGNPVLVRNEKHLASSFHPEIGEDLCIYKYFIKMINE